MTAPKNPIANFILKKDDFHFLGHSLNKPTCILATPDHDLWVTDSRGGVTKISITAGNQQFIGTEDNTNDQPSSMIFLDKQTMLLANIGNNCIELLDLTNGKRSLLYDSIDSIPIGKVNFLLQDSKNRIWLTITTKQQDIINALNPDICDGYIALLEKDNIKIVADGFSFTNEIRLDNDERYLYISETGKKRITRMKVNPDSTLCDREIYGPSDLGPANFPDGITFDSYGNLWGTIIGGEKIFALTPEGELKIIFDDGNPTAIKKIEAAYQSRSLTKDILFSGLSQLVPIMTSITFAGPNFRTAYIGSYAAKIPYFNSPVSGLAPKWWSRFP